MSMVPEPFGGRDQTPHDSFGVTEVGGYAGAVKQVPAFSEGPDLAEFPGFIIVVVAVGENGSTQSGSWQETHLNTPGRVCKGIGGGSACGVVVNAARKGWSAIASEEMTSGEPLLLWGCRCPRLARHMLSMLNLTHLDVPLPATSPSKSCKTSLRSSPFTPAS